MGESAKSVAEQNENWKARPKRATHDTCSHRSPPVLIRVLVCDPGEVLICPDCGLPVSGSDPKRLSDPRSK